MNNLFALVDRLRLLSLCAEDKLFQIRLSEQIRHVSSCSCKVRSSLIQCQCKTLDWHWPIVSLWECENSGFHLDLCTYSYTFIFSFPSFPWLNINCKLLLAREIIAQLNMNNNGCTTDADDKSPKQQMRSSRCHQNYVDCRKPKHVIPFFSASQYVSVLTEI